MDLLYCGRISHSPIIIYSWCHIINWYCNNSACHLCTTWGALAYDSNIFSVHYNQIAQLNILPTSTFQNFLWTTLLQIFLLQNYVLNFPLVIPLIFIWNKLDAGTFLPGSCKIHTLQRPFFVPLVLLPPLSHMVAEAHTPFHIWTSLYEYKIPICIWSCQRRSCHDVVL